MKKRLYRSRNRMIGGVCSGIAEYFNIDPVIVRAIFLGMLFFGGGGLILYLILLIIVPEKPLYDHYVEVNENGETIYVEDSTKDNAENHSDEAPNKTTKKNKRKRSSINSSNKFVTIIGLLFIVLGLFFLLQSFFPFFHLKYIIPTLFIIAGIILIINKTENRSNEN